MSFLSKRHIPSTEEEDQRKKKKIAELSVVETHSSFVSVYRELKEKTDTHKTEMGNADMSWLASLTAVGPATVEETSETRTAEICGENFWRPEELEKDFHEQRSFVRGDCKAQFLATKRKLKQRLFI